MKPLPVESSLLLTQHCLRTLRAPNIPSSCFRTPRGSTFCAAALEPSDSPRFCPAATEPSGSQHLAQLHCPWAKGSLGDCVHWGWNIHRAEALDEVPAGAPLHKGWLPASAPLGGGQACRGSSLMPRLSLFPTLARALRRPCGQGRVNPNSALSRGTWCHNGAVIGQVGSRVGAQQRPGRLGSERGSQRREGASPSLQPAGPGRARPGRAGGEWGRRGEAEAGNRCLEEVVAGAGGSEPRRGWDRRDPPAPSQLWSSAGGSVALSPAGPPPAEAALGQQSQGGF